MVCTLKAYLRSKKKKVSISSRMTWFYQHSPFFPFTITTIITTYRPRTHWIVTFLSSFQNDANLDIKVTRSIVRLDLMSSYRIIMCTYTNYILYTYIISRSWVFFVFDIKKFWIKNSHSYIWIIDIERNILRKRNIFGPKIAYELHLVFTWIVLKRYALNEHWSIFFKKNVGKIQ